MLRTAIYSLLLMFLSMQLSAQLPKGSTAPNFSVTDLNNNNFTLYNLTGAKKGVVIDFFATWCGPCWTFHNSGVASSIVNNLGHIASVVALEADSRTNINCLYGSSGCNYSTYGNWTTVPYSMADLNAGNGPGVKASYAISYYPTVYVISHDNRAFEVRNKSYTVFRSWLQESFFLDVNPVITNAACGDDGMIDLNRTKGYGSIRYNWSNGDQTEDLVGVPAGTYSVTVEDANGYDKVFGPYVIQGPSAPLEVDVIDYEDVSCFNGSDGYALADGTGGNGGYSYQWSNGQTGAQASGLSVGVYRVSITDSKGCQEVQTHTVQQPSPLTSGANAVNEDCGLQNGEIYINAQGGVKPYQYSIGQGYSFNSIHKNLKAGLYTVSVKDNNDCITEFEQQIRSNDGPTALAGDDKLMDCSVATLTITGSGSSGSHIDYLWSTDDGNIISSEDQQEIEVDAPGMYIFQVKDNSTDCVTWDTMVVEDKQIMPQLETIDADTLTCDLDEVWIEVKEKQDVGLFWSTREGEILSKDDSSSVQVDQSAWYYIRATHDISECQEVDSIWVEGDQEAPEFQLIDELDQTCSGEILTLEATDWDAMKNLTFLWSTTTGNIVGPIDQHKAEVDQPGMYELEITNLDNGCISRDTVEVFNEWNEAQAGYSSAKTHLEVQFTDQSEGENLSWSWDFGDTNTSSEQNPLHEYSSKGTYEVCLTVTNECGSDTQCEDIEVGLTTFSDDLKSSFHVDLYPNPGVDQLCIQSHDETLIKIEVINILGVKNEIGMNNDCISTDHWESGIYILKCWNDKGRFVSLSWVKE